MSKALLHEIDAEIKRMEFALKALRTARDLLEAMADAAPPVSKVRQSVAKARATAAEPKPRKPPKAKAAKAERKLPGKKKGRPAKSVPMVIAAKPAEAATPKDDLKEFKLSTGGLVWVTAEQYECLDLLDMKFGEGVTSSTLKGCFGDDATAWQRGMRELREKLEKSCKVTIVGIRGVGFALQTMESVS